ncbi:LURP1-related protein domain containing protein [Parasponia andersonii]|uniref:LURP1-related protein domain containing protein n=1 Tax=Parasponia andersonii TaxID=3476 RepID=A0A2P5ATL1_PARAD|nr:LURP1-related protein domain containing protein [Parasponia andersonii]
MKTFLSLKSLSRTVHDDQEQHHQDSHRNHDQDHNKQQQQYDNQTDVVSTSSTSLTVWRKSLLISCNGFTVIDSNGDLFYRVDNYIGRPEEITLMDSSGKSVLTMHRRTKLRLVDSWCVYEGEVGNNNCHKTIINRSSSSRPKRPIFSIKKNVSLLINGFKSHVLAYVFRDSSSEKRSCAYVIEGSYTHRSCKVLDEWSKKVVAEIRRKEETVGGVSFGVEVFQLIVQPGFEPRFAMGFVLLLDQMFS